MLKDFLYKTYRTTVSVPISKEGTMIQQTDKGIFLTTDQGTLSLVAEDGKPPYIAFYPAKPAGLPPMALVVQDGKPILQLSKDGKTVNNLNLLDLVTG